MRILNVLLENFASYERLGFEYDNQGLTLVQGPTGSGKSTLMDAVPWILFGRTAKGGAVDEVRAWPGDKVTKGSIVVEVGIGAIIIERKRGSAKDNDLCYWVGNSDAKRGKDLKDTQNQINQLLGIDCDLYLAGAYYHEFSQTAQFFNATAKDRRTLCEQIVDLSLAKTLQQQTAEDLKKAAKEADRLSQIATISQAQLKIMASTLKSEREREKAWQDTLKQQTTEQQIKMLQFEDTRYEQSNALRKEIKHAQDMIKTDVYFELTGDNLMKAIDEAKARGVCEHCGADKDSEEVFSLRNKFNDLSAERRLSDVAKSQASSLTKRLDALKKEANPYEEAPSTTNPHTETVNDLLTQIAENTASTKEAAEQSTKYLEQEADLELLLEVIAEYRALSVKNTIEYIQNQTNQLLSGHFDAEIKVGFEVVDADKLDVTITKDGNLCVYSQLSKGQRQLLKLCFSVAVMRQISNHHGVKFEQVFMDEALDGMDDNLKLKALGLLNQLSTEYNSVFVIEHNSEIKAMVNNSYSVTLVNGHSQIEES